MTPIDVLIPAYNAAATVEQSIGTIQRQTLRDIRIVVVDDGSTDATAEILARMAADDERILVVRQENGGIVDALNRGLAECRAPLIARFDADDLSYPGRLERQAGFLRDRPDMVAVGCSVRHIDEFGRPTGTIGEFEDPSLASPLVAPSHEPYICHPFLMVRREAATAAGGYRHVFLAEDTDLYWRLGELGRLHNLPEILGDYRMHTGSLSGASLVNGRVMSVFSQLAGLSAARRSRAVPDLAFPRELLGAARAAADLEAMVGVAARRLSLTPEEEARLAIMASAKLVSLANYRPFELSLADCRFARAALLRHGDLLAPDNARALRMMAWGSAARLGAAARPREAMALVGPRDYPHVAARLAFRIATTPRLRRVARRLTGRAVLAK